MTEQGVRLADAIDDLRRELSDARDRGRGQSVQFELGAISMEFEVAITTGGEAKAGAQFWVLSVGGSAKRENVATHRVTLSLTPVVDGERNPLINDRIAADDLDGP